MHRDAHKWVTASSPICTNKVVPFSKRVVISKVKTREELHALCKCMLNKVIAVLNL